MKAAGSLLAVEGAATGAGTEVESKELILPAPTPWDNQEPWDVPRESLETASLELKARADSFKRLENFGTAEKRTDTRCGSSTKSKCLKAKSQVDYPNEIRS